MVPEKLAKRVKTGCVTCRIRRVKCDEEKPECKRCTSTGRKCDGYSTLPYSRRDLVALGRLATQHRHAPGAWEPANGRLPQPVVDPAFHDLLERRYFQFFRHRTVASTNSMVDSRFWDRVVLQASHTEPAIKHAVLALSSLHQLNGLGLEHSGEAARQHRLYAEEQHHKALVEARNLIASATPQDVDRILIACVVFIIFEGVRGDYMAAAKHTDSGRAILTQHAARLSHISRRKDLQEIQRGLARLDLSAICFSDSSSPYPYGLTDFFQTAPLLHVGPFQDIDEAQASLVDLARWLQLLCQQTDIDYRSDDWTSLARHQEGKKKCAALVSSWHDHFSQLIRRSDGTSASTILYLQIMHAGAMIDTRVEKYGPSTQYDACMDEFERICELAEKLAPNIAEPGFGRSFSFELGYAIPVFYTATRCRDPKLRRRAIALLRDYPRQEAVWDSVAAGIVAQRWMEVEEAGLGEVRSASDVPESRRIRDVDAEVDFEQGAASLRFSHADERAPTEVTAVVRA